MLNKLIESCLRQPLIVVIVFFLLTIAGYRAMLTTPVDAIPDLSDVQVIVKASFPGQSPDLVEEQVTYPLSTLLMSVPGSATVRGFSFFNDAYLYVIFEEGTDVYWARSRVLEYLDQAKSNLPEDVTVEMGPDASGVGWVFQYVLKDTSGTRHLGELTRLQDWFIRQELQAVKGVSEVAKVGGMVQTYQVVVHPLKLLNYGLTLSDIHQSIWDANSQVGGSVIELAEAEYMVRSHGYLNSLQAFESIPLGVTSKNATPVMLRHVATIRLGPQIRRGVAEWNGEGEVVGGIVLMRDGENPLEVIKRVKDKLQRIQDALPDGVEIETAYDRSSLIKRSIDYLKEKLVQEIIFVALVCGLLLLHVRATLIIALCLPIALLLGFLVMKLFGVSANIMSLGGIAIAIGALVDAAIVMVENVQKQQLNHQKSFNQSSYTVQNPVLAESAHKRAGTVNYAAQIDVVRKACIQVGPAIFISLIIITFSFLPIFALEGQEGKLFSPMALTKTFVMSSAALISITLVPVLCLLCLKGKVVDENANPINRFLKALYKPLLKFSLRWPALVVLLALILAASAIYPWQKLGSEFMPAFDEGDILYMPTMLPGVSIQEAGQVLQQTDRLIKTVPEVLSVMGKVGRADTATDPAPLTMIETTIQLKPHSEWRAGTDLVSIIAELEQKVQFPGLTNAWVQPIKTRIDMLSTGVKTPVGIKLSGSDLASIQEATQAVESAVSILHGTVSVIGERPVSGRYIDVTPNRAVAAQYGVRIVDIHYIVRMAIGGQQIDESIQGTERFPINLRYPRAYRDNVETLKALPFLTPSGAWVTLGQIAEISISDGPSVIKSENARTVGWVYIDIQADMALGEYVANLKDAMRQVILPERVTWAVAGQYEYLERVSNKLTWIVPATVLIIFILLQLLFKTLWQSLLVLATLPVALSGSLWLVFLLDYQLSVALAVGMIALAGVAAEFGVVMLMYLNSSWREHKGTVNERIEHGAIQRLRPKAMTVITIVASLLPLLFGTGSGSEVMQRIAAPMLGGMMLCPMLSMLFIPAVYRLVRE